MNEIGSDYSLNSRTTHTTRSRCFSFISDNRLRQSIATMLVCNTETQGNNCNEQITLEEILTEHQTTSRKPYIEERSTRNNIRDTGNSVYESAEAKSMQDTFDDSSGRTRWSQSNDKRKVSLYTESNLFQTGQMYQRHKDHERRASFILADRKGLQCAEKMTYCRPVIRFNQEYTSNFTEKKQKLQSLVQKIIEARENEKQMTAWDKYIQNLKVKHEKTEVNDTRATTSIAPFEVASNKIVPLSKTVKPCNKTIVIENDYKTRRKPSYSSYCGNILEDLYDSDSCRAEKIMGLLRKNTAVNTDTNKLNLPLFYEPNPYFCHANNLQGRITAKKTMNNNNTVHLDSLEYAGKPSGLDGSKGIKSYRNGPIIIRRVVSKKNPPKNNKFLNKDRDRNHYRRTKTKRKQENTAQTENVEETATQTEDISDENAKKLPASKTSNNPEVPLAIHSDTEHSEEKKEQTFKEEVVQTSNNIINPNEKDENQNLTENTEDITQISSNAEKVKEKNVSQNLKVDSEILFPANKEIELKEDTLQIVDNDTKLKKKSDNQNLTLESKKMSHKNKEKTLQKDITQISRSVGKLKEINSGENPAVDSKILESIENKLDLLIIAINSLIINYKTMDLECTEECISRKPFNFDFDFGDLSTSNKKEATNTRCNLSNCTNVKCKIRKKTKNEKEITQEIFVKERQTSQEKNELRKQSTLQNLEIEGESDNEENITQEMFEPLPVKKTEAKIQDIDTPKFQTQTGPSKTQRTDRSGPNTGEFKRTTDYYHCKIISPGVTNRSENVRNTSLSNLKLKNATESFSKNNFQTTGIIGDNGEKKTRDTRVQNIVIQESDNDDDANAGGIETKAEVIRKRNFGKSSFVNTCRNQYRSDIKNLGLITNEKIICGVVTDDTNSLYRSDAESSQFDRILIEEMDKSDQVKRDIEDILNGESCRPCAVQINIDVPTRERCTEVTESLSRTRLAGEIMPEFAQSNNADLNRTITIAVNTDPLSLLALFRISTDTIKELLSYMQGINYSSFLPSISRPMTRQLMGREDKFYCFICGETFNLVSQLRKHLQGHEASANNCCVCRHLLDNQKRQNPIGLFSCQYCGQCFTRAYCRELHEQACARQCGREPEISEDLAILR